MRGRCQQDLSGLPTLGVRTLPPTSTSKNDILASSLRVQQWGPFEKYMDTIEVHRAETKHRNTWVKVVATELL